MLSVKEREKQCQYLLEEISTKTAEIVLSEEHVFAERAERMLHAVFNKMTELHQSISGKVIVTTPGSLDDAKKGEDIEKTVEKGGRVVEGEGGSGEGVRRIEASSLIKGGSGSGVGEEEQMEDEARVELARKKGKDKVLEEPRKPLAGKLLASSLASHPAVQTKEQIEADEAFALALQQEFNLRTEGVTEIPLAEPLQTVAGATSSQIQAPATTAALASSTIGAASASQAIVPTQKKQMPPPPPPVPKTHPKRSAPDTREEDPAAKRQRTVARKTSRMKVRRRSEEGKKKHEEKEKRLKLAREKVVEGRIESHWNEVRLIQGAISRSSYVPFTPEEFEACQAQAMIDTCRVTIKEMTDSRRYTAEDIDFIRKRVNEKLPRFNFEASAKFHKIMEELSSRTEDELVERRANHLDAREIEDFIPSDLLEMWLFCREKFIKAYYFWEVVPYQDQCSRMDALNNFLCQYNEELRRKIFTQAELADPKPIIIKVPAVKEFPMPLLPNSSVPNRRIIEEEVDEALRLENSFRDNVYNVRTMEEKVLSAYFLEEEKEEEQKKPAEDL